MLLYSPLEKCQISYILPASIGQFDFSITSTFSLYCIIAGLCLSVYIYGFQQNKTNRLFSRFTVLAFETFFEFLITVASEILTKQGVRIFPFIFLPSLSILFLNLIGLLPFSTTLTAQLLITASFAFTSWFSLVYLGFKIHKFNFFSTLLPQGTSFFVSFLLIPVELVSFLFRPISLSVRLFSNLVTGHTLLKVIFSFSWKLLLVGSIFHIITGSLLIILLILESSVACIQAYVFTLLIIIYTNEMRNLH